MPSLHQPSVMHYRNPNLRGPIGALITFLLERDYTTSARWSIADFAAVNGTLAGSLIEPEDEAAAEELFVDAMPAVPENSDAWDRDESVYLDAEMLADGVHPLPFGEGPDAPDADPAIAFPGIAPLSERMPLAPVCGGGPDDDGPDPSEADARNHREWLRSLAFDDPDERFAPSAADWAEYRAHLDLVEPRYGYE